MTNEKEIHRMRSIAECVSYIKEQDPQTCITQYFVRNLVKAGLIPCHYSGCKILVDLDALLAFLLSCEQKKVAE